MYSYAGLIVLGAVRSAPVLFLFVYPAFQAMDATLEEAARIAGAGGWRTVFRINLPLLLPALLASGILSFVVAMESFEIPQLLGTPAKIFVFTTKIYDLAYGGHVARFGPAMVLAVLLLLLTFSLIVLQWKMLGGRAYTTVSGRGYQARPLDLGAWRWVAFAFIVGFFLVFGALPFVVLLLNSFMQLSGFLGWEMLTTSHWRDALGRSAVLTSIKDTLLVGVAAATIGMIASALISYVVTRTTWPGRKVLDMVAWAPWAVPGLVMALGFLWAFVWLPIYGSAVAARPRLRGAGAARGLALLHGHDGADRRRAGGVGAHPRGLLAAHVRAHLDAALAPGHAGGVDSAVRHRRAGAGPGRALRRSGQPRAVGRHLPLDRHRPAGSGLRARPAADGAGAGRLRCRAPAAGPGAPPGRALRVVMASPGVDAEIKGLQ